MNRFIATTVLCFLAVVVGSANGQSTNETQKKGAAVSSDPSSSKSASRTRGPKELDGISPKRKKELIRFVNEHHPELKKLLQILEKRRPEKYNAAMQGLSQSYDRLVALEGDPKKHQAALDSWKLKSRIDLLAARIALKDNPDQRKQLHRLVSDGVDNRTEQLQAEKLRIEQRLKRIDQQLERLSDNREQEIERQVDLAIRKIRNALGVDKNGEQRKVADPESPPTKESKNSGQ